MGVGWGTPEWGPLLVPDATPTVSTNQLASRHWLSLCSGKPCPYLFLTPRRLLSFTNCFCLELVTTLGFCFVADGFFLKKSKRKISILFCKWQRKISLLFSVTYVTSHRKLLQECLSPLIKWHNFLSDNENCLSFSLIFLLELTLMVNCINYISQGFGIHSPSLLLY